MRFTHPQEPRGTARARARRSRTAPAGARSTATSRSSRAHEGAARGRGPRARASPRPRLHRASTPRASTRSQRRSTSAHLGRDPRARAASRASRCARPPRRDRSPKRTIACWAMGLTQHRNAVDNIQEIVNFLLLRGSSAGRAPGPAPCAATATCRATAPWASGRSMPDAFLDRLGADVRLRAAARARLRHRWARSTRCTTGGRTSSSPWAATSSPPRPTPSSPRCPAALPPHGARLHQAATAVTWSRASRRSSCLAWAGPRRRAGRRPQFVTVEDSMGLVHASRGKLRAGQRAPA